MSWQIAATANAVILIAYLAIAVALARPLLATRQIRSNPLGWTTVAIFVSCAVHHGAHSLHMAAPSLGVDDAVGLTMRGAFTWQMAVWDVLGAAIALAYWAQRRSAGDLIEGAALFTDLEQRAARAADHKALHAVAETAARESNVVTVCDVAAEQAATLLGTASAAVWRYDGDVAIAVARHGLGGTAGHDVIPLPHDDTLVGRVHAAGRSQRIAYVDEPGAGEIRASAIALGLRSGCAAPIRVRGELWGCVAVASTERASIPAHTEERLAAFAELVAIAVDNAEAHQRLVDLATTDHLTGLANHRAFHERLADEVARARRHGAPLALALLDLDHFKHVNDQHGHLAGDRVLASLAERLVPHVRQGDLLARIGGEELGWLMPHASAEDAAAAIERAREDVGALGFDGVGVVTFSAGVATLGPRDDAEALYQAADVALYRAKASGRDRVERADAGVEIAGD